MRSLLFLSVLGAVYIINKKFRNIRNVSRKPQQLSKYILNNKNYLYNTPIYVDTY